MSYFGTIYADTELPSRARAVYMYLRDRADSEGKCWPGIKTIASDMRLSRSTVKRALTDLEQHGYLQKIPRYRDNGRSNPNLYLRLRESFWAVHHEPPLGPANGRSPPLAGDCAFLRPYCTEYRLDVLLPLSR